MTGEETVAESARKAEAGNTKETFFTNNSVGAGL